MDERQGQAADNIVRAGQAPRQESSAQERRRNQNTRGAGNAGRAEGRSAQDTSNDDDGDVGEDEDDDEEDPEFDATALGLKEIGNLASFTVSSYKPGCGVKELRHDDFLQYWQSDGLQPHRLNIHFIKRVEIRALRIYVDHDIDESYTPTKIQITAGTGPNLTIPFTTMVLTDPKGWIDIPMSGAGGGSDGHSLCCFFLRLIVLENHQNGKDTHLRGIKVYALDDTADTAENNQIEELVGLLERCEKKDSKDEHDALLKHDAKVQAGKSSAGLQAPGDGMLAMPDWMKEPEIR